MPDIHQPAYGQTGVMGQLGLTDSFEELVAKYGRDSAEYIRETLGDWRQHYDRLLYLQMGTCDEQPFIDAARGRAEENGWRFERADGDLSLLEKLFNGPWDDDFVIVPPGHRLIARNDERILEAE